MLGCARSLHVVVSFKLGSWAPEREGPTIYLLLLLRSACSLCQSRSAHFSGSRNLVVRSTVKKDGEHKDIWIPF